MSRSAKVASNSEAFTFPKERSGRVVRHSDKASPRKGVLDEVCPACP